MAGRRLDLDIGQQAEFATQRRSFGKAGNALAVAGIEREENGIGRFADRAAAVGRAFQRFVVDQDRRAVRREHHVELDRPVAEPGRQPDSGQRVFRRQRAAAAMGNPARQRRHAHQKGWDLLHCRMRGQVGIAAA